MGRGGHAKRQYMRISGLLPISLILGLTALSASALDHIPDDRPLNGVFSIGEGKTVYFSKGNLQFHPISGTWRFAPQQNFTCGSGNFEAINQTNSAYYMDLFSWGTSGYIWSPDAAFMSSSSTYNDHSDIANTPLDWGVNNSRQDEDATKWRTLTRNEWIYLFCHRERADELLALAQVSQGKILKKSGLVILPDNWNSSEVSFQLKTVKDIEMKKYSTYYELYTTNSFYRINDIDEASWLEMEQKGAVFLPVTGIRAGTDILQGYEDGWYWSSSCAPHDFASEESPDKDTAGAIRFWTTPNGMSGSTYIHAAMIHQRFIGMAVRLVCDNATNDFTTDIIHAPEGYVNGVFSLSETKKVHFAQGNLQYNPASNQWQFASSQYEIAGPANFNPDAEASSWMDVFGWATSGVSLHVPYENSTLPWVYGNGNKDITNTTLDWALANPIVNGGNRPGLWRTPSSAEMEYLLCRRPQASSKAGLGSVDNVRGLIILPDKWKQPEDIPFVGFGDGMLNSNGFYYTSVSGHFSNNRYTRDQWSKLEKLGAVFLPLTGVRVGSNYQSSASGFYWTSSTSPYGQSDNSLSLYFFSDGQTLINPHYELNKCVGASIRPVTPILNGSTDISDIQFKESLKSDTHVVIYDIAGNRCYEGEYAACPKLDKGVYIIHFNGDTIKVSF